MNKVLVVTYSHTGTGRKLAWLLSSLQHCQMVEITEDRPRSNWRCILDSLLRRCPPIRYDGPDPRRFDIVVLVAPIWAGRLAGPMRSFVASRRALLPDVAVLTVMGHTGAAGAVSEIAKLLGRSPLLDAAFTTADVEDGSFAARLQAFGQAVESARDKKRAARAPELAPRAA
jgi:flavodoxin